MGRRAADDCGRRRERDQLPCPWSWHCRYHKGQRRLAYRLSLPLPGRPQPLPSGAQAARPGRQVDSPGRPAQRCSAEVRGPRLPGPVRPARVPNARRAQNVNVRSVDPRAHLSPLPVAPQFTEPGISRTPVAVRARRRVGGAGTSSGWRGSAPQPGYGLPPSLPPAPTAQESPGRNTRTRSGHFESTAKVHSTPTLKEPRVLRSEERPGGSGAGGLRGAGWPGFLVSGLFTRP